MVTIREYIHPNESDVPADDVADQAGADLAPELNVPLPPEHVLDLVGNHDLLPRHLIHNRGTLLDGDPHLARVIWVTVPVLCSVRHVCQDLVQQRITPARSLILTFDQPLHHQWPNRPNLVLFQSYTLQLAVGERLIGRRQVLRRERKQPVRDDRVERRKESRTLDKRRRRPRESRPSPGRVPVAPIPP